MHLEGCLICSDLETCLQCRSNFDLENGECVDMISIPHCEEVDPERINICLECEEGYGISYDQRRCSNCQDIDVACTECVSEFGMADICEDCIWPTTLVDGTCVWEGCDSWEMTPKGLIECDECSIGFSMFDGACVQCIGDQENNAEYWNHCASCSFDENGDPFDCLSCVDGTGEAFASKILLSLDEETTPQHYCAYPRISNCVDQGKDDQFCEVCESGYFSIETECLSCGIERCQECEPSADDEDLFSCLTCDADFETVDDNGRDVCDWKVRIPNCE